MDTVFAVPVFHIGGSLVRNAEGILVYEGGSVEKFDRMDLNLVNLEDLVKLLEDELGYKTKKKLHWLDVADDHLESGLYCLHRDKEINAMRENVLRNYGLSEEFHIYVEHEVSMPHPAENPPAQEAEAIVIDDEDSSSSSTDDGGYESADDELYKPPKFVSEEDDTDSEVEGSSRKSSQKGKSANPKHKGRRSVSNAGEKGEGVGSKPKAAMGGLSVNDEDGPADEGVPGPSVKNGVKFYQLEVPSSEEEYAYEYESETFHTHVSSDGEFSKHKWQEFNVVYGFGQGHFEIGTKFATLESFKDVVKDQFIAKDRQLDWKKNDKATSSLQGQKLPLVGTLLPEFYTRLRPSEDIP
ncbi:hypothetical protein PIB30_030768 [Stylosanthes scabra]|uniref:PB1-like domain-containing protein n=1 Tax=Stylosanthes scabra TaxID=79078 RepID=A0ABU6YAH2_9FABA|nr:hypothetical protein [Stylosanthes scabra]